MSVEIEIHVKPKRDEDNSYPPRVTFTRLETGSVNVRLIDPPRELVFSEEDWDRIVKTL